ncbi:MAG: DUF4325 domain-containing protein, partial [Endomicrobiia bacterium]|nr:DUF4325 domain-containing protein [Endomicrobiia bacterium]
IDAAKVAALVKKSGEMLGIHRILNNNGKLREDEALREIKKDSGIFAGLPKNIAEILDYAFTEMLNNAIEHSGSQKIDVIVRRAAGVVRFVVTDRGVGIFRNIMKKKKLSALMDAVQDLLKGKQTTMPDRHSGEGIFFTSKTARRFSVKSSGKSIIYDNDLNDIAVKDTAFEKGTKVVFETGLKNPVRVSEIFRRHTDENYRFDKTLVAVKLYDRGVEYVSRSQARRLLCGLEDFKRITLDFKGVSTIGQAFADEIFRVWPSSHSGVAVDYLNAGENVETMIKMAKSEPPPPRS